MIPHPKILLSLLFGVALPAAAVHAQTPPAPASLADKPAAASLPKTAAEWSKRLIAYAQSEEPGDNILHEFAYIAPEIQLAALRDCWKKLTKEQERAHLMEVTESETAGQGNYEPDDAPVSADRINPLLLDILAFGATDDSADVRKRTFDCLTEIAGRQFSDPKEFLAWRKAQGDKSLTEITKNGVTALFAQFAKADDKSRAALYETMAHFVFVSDSRAAANHPLGGADAIKLTAVRRQAALDSGLLDALALRLHKPSNGLESAEIAGLLIALQPDDAYLTQIEPDMRREIPALAAAPTGQDKPGVSTLVMAVTLLTRYRSEWAVTALNHLIETTYSASSAVEMVNGLTGSRSPRVIPLLIPLLGSMPADLQTSALDALAKLTRVPGGAKQSAAWWREWLTKNAGVLPEDVRNLPLPKLKSDLELWTARLTAQVEDSIDYRQRESFMRLDSALQLEVLRAVLPKITNENLRRDLLSLATAGNGGSGEESDPKPKPVNSHLLEMLDLGANDPALSVQQQAFATAGDLAMQTFADKETYLAWRKQTGGKSAEEIVRDGAKTMAAQFRSADAAEKLERFDPLLRVSYVTSRSAQTAQAVTTHTTTAGGLEKIRREAFQQAGLLDTMAQLLSDAKTTDLALKALSFFGAFQPDEATLKKIEPDVRALLESQIAHDGAMPDNAANLIFRYPSAWVLPLIVKWTLRDYLTSGFDTLNSALADAADARTLPILIALTGTVSKNDANNLLVAASSITGIAYDPAHDGAWWRQWWEKNKVKYPAEIRDLTLPGMKTGAAALEERIAFHSEQYGMDYRTRNQFSELEPEAKYKVIREMWNRDLPDSAKSSMLMTLSEWQNGVSQLETNPHLLDEIHLGMMDEGQQTQQQAAMLLFSLTLQSFPDTDDYLAWRKRSAVKPLADLVREGAAAFVTRFKKADEARKIELLQQAQQIQFADGVSSEIVGGKPVETVQAKGLTDIRRKAVIAAGLPDAAAALGQSDKPAAVTAAANFLSSFHPGGSYLAGIENGVRRVSEKILANQEDDSPMASELLLQYHGAWVGEVISQFVQKMYLRPNGVNFLRMMMYSRDARVTPLLISLIDSVAAGDRQQIMRQLSEITKVPFEGSHDSAWWREWWKTNRDKQPAEAQAMALLDLKKGPEIVTARLIATKDTDWEALQLYDTLDMETQYAILRDNWKKISNESARVNLLERACNDNAAGQGSNTPVAPQDRPHLLDIIALGVGDSAEQVRNDALGFASNLAARKIKDAADFAAWRKANGDKTLMEIVRANTLNLIERMKRADAKTLPELLDEAGNMQWYSFQSGDGGVDSPESKVTAVGLAAVRRKAAIDAGLPDKIAEWLKATDSPEAAKSALNLMVQFLPGRAFMQAAEPDVKRIVLAKKPQNEEYDFFLSRILSYYNSKWATDILLATAKAQYAANEDAAINLLVSSRDARVVPSLISALANMEEQSWRRQQVNQALARLTHTGGGANQSAEWWRGWWKKNRENLPAAAQAEPFPNFQSAKVAQEFSVRRTRKQITIGGDPKRSYWFVTSGLLLKRKPAAKTAANPVPAAPPADFSDIPAAARPGLLVVLSDGDADGADTRYWQNLVGKNFGGKYLAAVVVAPQWSAKQTPLWLTKTERGNAKTAAFTTETFAAQIVKDVEAKYPVNPNRVFLVGAGAGGSAVYACSLQPATPFAGFALIGSPFHPANLPPFTCAKGRRYYLLRSPDDKQTPLFLAQAARDTLQKAGAKVTLMPYAIEPDAAQKAPRDVVAAGVKWLETK